MPGYNHYPDCGCGWCVKDRLSEATSIFDQATRNQPTWSVESGFDAYTIPNAKCPVCGDPVFFYQSPNGGRVFFDELGPPWPKHPCTDNYVRPRRSPAEQTQAAIGPQWRRDGWVPIQIGEVNNVWSEEWRLVRIRRVGSQKWLTRVVPRAASPDSSMPALMKPINDLGVGQVSWLSRFGGLPATTWLNFRGFKLCRIAKFEAGMADDRDAMAEIGARISIDWIPLQSGRTSLEAPKWLDLKFGHAWLLKAERAGSMVARKILADSRFKALNP
ncbi:MAG: hypothetical protein QM698_12090 [Micropepsaceae bacterium]